MQVHKNQFVLLERQFSYLFFFLALLTVLPVSGASNVAVSLGNNPNPEINGDTLVANTIFSARLNSSVKFDIKHAFQKKGAERTESSKINIMGGNPFKLAYKISHGFGQRSQFFSYSSTGVQLMKRLENTRTSGFYEYNEDNYLFGTYRRAEFGPGYRWDNSLIYMGARVEKIGDSNMSFLYLVSVSHQLKYVVGKIQAKLYGGPQYIVDGMKVNEPEFGFRVKLMGQWLPPGMPENTQISYGLNGLLVNRNAGMYRRFGGEMGFVYQL